MVEVLHDDKMLVDALNPKRTEVREARMVEVLHDDKVLIYARMLRGRREEKARW